MRAKPGHGKYGPISLTTSRRIGVPGMARQHDTDQSSERRADPIHFFGAKMRDERVHVGAILRQRIFVGISQTAAAPAPDEVGAHDAPSRCREVGREIVKIAPLAAEPMNANDRELRIGTAPNQHTQNRESRVSDRPRIVPLRSGSGLSDCGSRSIRGASTSRAS